MKSTGAGIVAALLLYTASAPVTAQEQDDAPSYCETHAQTCALLRQALDTSQTIASIPHYFEARYGIVRALVAVGLTGDARDVLDAAEQTAERINYAELPGYRADIVLARAHMAVDEAGPAAAALALASDDALAIEGDRARGRALYEVAIAHARAGLADAAASHATAVPREALRTLAMAATATALAEAGLPDEAAALAEQAVDLAPTLEDDDELGTALIAASEALAAAGRWQAALDIEKELPDGADWLAPHLAVAVAQGRAGQADEARSTFAAAEAQLAERGNPDRPWDALSDMSRAQAEAGLPDDAIATALKIANALWQGDTLLDVAEIFIAAERWDDAAAVARANPQPWQRTIALAELTVALAAAGRSDDADVVIAEALASVETVTDSLQREFAASDIAGALGAVGRWDDAFAAATAATEPNRYSQALSAIAKAQAVAGLFDVAMETTQRVSGRADHAAALRAIVEAQSEAAVAAYRGE